MRLQAAYNLEQAFLVPSVHNLVTSAVVPLSKYLETGRPTVATPTIRFVSKQAIENL